MTDVDKYLTIAGRGEGVYREKMSKFMSFASPVSTPAEAKAFISGIASEYHDARHVCWAYMTGEDRSDFLSSDNGEPSGTAGKPILGQINSFNLTNVAIAVVRYFGGIKLGPSGLITAYRTAAREAIENAGVVEAVKKVSLSFDFPYLVMNDVMKLVKKMQVDIASQSFDNLCSMTLTMPRSLKPRVASALSDIEGTNIKD